MPAGFELTLPVPVPARRTDRLRWPRTVSVVLPVSPVESVAVIVVTPALTPVARPLPSMVATPVLLLVHAMPDPPVPRIVTGTEEPVVVPFPSWPQSFAPQHFTVPSPRTA